MSVRLNPPSSCLCSGAITAGGTSLKSWSKACALRLREGDVVVLIASTIFKYSAVSLGLSPPAQSFVWAVQQVGPGPHACHIACLPQNQGD